MAYKKADKKEFKCPSYMGRGLMYQIFPDRFKRSPEYKAPAMNKNYVLRDDWGGIPNYLPDNGVVLNNDFFGGNIKGIIEELPYLAELGVTIIYMNPIFEAFSNHRYDTADYKKIDPLLGTEDDFKELCRKAGEKGIKIVLDGVFNHTGSDSIYFNKNGRYPEVGAYQSKDSPYYSWYRFIDYPDNYESWWGVDTLPHVNEGDPSYLDFILNDEDSVVKHWLKAGASGFRLDVVDELPDVFLDRFREVVKEWDKDAVIIGEVWEDAATKISYGQKRHYLDGTQLDSVMNYPLRTGILDFFEDRITGKEFLKAIGELEKNYPETVFYGLMNILGTHDTERILSILGQRKLFAALPTWALMPGIPCLYYGDENGMEGGKDPLNRGCFEPEKRNVDIYRHFRKLFAFKSKLEAIDDLSKMKYEASEQGDDYYDFQRKGKKARLIVCTQRKGKRTINLKLKAKEEVHDFFISGNVYMKDFTQFIMRGCSSFAVIIEKKA